MDAEDVTIYSSDQVSHKFDALVKMVTDLSRHEEATEEHQKGGGTSPSDSQSTSHPRRRARHHGTPDQTQDLAEEVHQRVAKRTRELPSYNEATTEEDSTSDEEDQQFRRKKKKGLKSGMHHTGAAPW